MNDWPRRQFVHGDLPDIRHTVIFTQSCHRQPELPSVLTESPPIHARLITPPTPSRYSHSVVSMERERLPPDTTGSTKLDGARTQLRVLAELNSIFASQKIGFWLRGGWALDFLLGAVTRAHADIDVVSWARQRARIHRALLAHGFSHVRDFPAQSDFSEHGVEVSIVYIARAKQGIVTPGIPEWTWHAGALTRRLLTLEGLTLRVLSPYQLLDEKLTFGQGVDRPALRPKDMLSVNHLGSLLAEQHGQHLLHH